MDTSTLTYEVVAGVVFVVAAFLILVFRRTYTRWVVAYYMRIAHAAPWLIPARCESWSPVIDRIIPWPIEPPF